MTNFQSDWSNVFLLSERFYSASNWTVPTMPKEVYHRRLRSMNYEASTSNDSRLRWGTRNYQCRDCGRTFSLKASLVRHKSYECDGQQVEQGISKLKNKNKHVCPKCNRSYVFFTSLWRHQHYECGVEPRFICVICRKKFAQKSNLDRHVRSRHWRTECFDLQLH